MFNLTRTKWASRLAFLGLTMSLCLVVQAAQAAAAVSNLRGVYRSGQVFLTWNEANVPAGTTFNVYLASAPIDAGSVANAALVGHHVEPHSATDWWLDPSSFNAEVPSRAAPGFVIENGGAPLNPRSGLFVHTVTDDNVDKMYFAVTTTSADGAEDRSVSAGANTINQPIRGEVAMPQPVRLRDTLSEGAGEAQSLTLVLHGRGADGAGSPDNASYVMFGTSKHGWRQGLARRFTVYANPDGIVIEPYDRMWVGRSLMGSGDRRDGGKAINTWWYGVNNKIYDETESASGVVVNYTERYLLWLTKWAQSYYRTDPAQTVLSGFSMGATGAISMAFHHPDVFSYVIARVPQPAYTQKEGLYKMRSITRLNGLVGGREADEQVMSDEGLSVVDRMDAARIAREYPGELPFLVLMNGRSDGSMPWANNPPFYEALQAGRRGVMVYWDNGGHEMYKTVPGDVENYIAGVPTPKLGQAYPAFSRFSADANAGNGDAGNGDLVGSMNRGLSWEDVQDTAQGFGVTIRAAASWVSFPAQVDVTPRRLSRFVIAPNATVQATVNGQTRSVQADAKGWVTVEGVSLSSAAPVRLEITR